MSRSSAALAILAVAAVLYIATAASASANWLVGGSVLSGSAALATTASVDQHFELKVGALSIAIECAGSTLNSTSPEIRAPNSIAVVSLTFNECKTTTAPCTLATKAISTVPLVAEVTQQASPEDKAIFTPKTKSIFATVKFNGETCALQGVQPITGKATTALPTGQEERTLQEVRATGTKGELKIGSSEAEFKGAALLKLAAGQRFAALAPTITVNPVEATFKVEVGKTKQETFVFTNHGPGDWLPKARAFKQEKKPEEGAEITTKDECFNTGAEEGKTCDVVIEIKVNEKGTYSEEWALEGAPTIKMKVEA